MGRPAGALSRRPRTAGAALQGGARAEATARARNPGAPEGQGQARGWPQQEGRRGQARSQGKGLGLRKREWRRALDGEETDGVTLIQRLHEWAGEHGIGRIDHVEDRLVGIKSREIYEAPAAITLLRAHEALEQLTLSKSQRNLKARLASEYADLIYNGLWFTAHHQDLASYVQSTQRHVSGTVRMRLHKGQATPVGRRSPKSLYDFALLAKFRALRPPEERLAP